MSEESIITEERRFAILSKKSIKTIAESAGHPDISDEVASLLAEDSNYRAREVIQNSLKYMKHARRRRLIVDDFNKALKSSDNSILQGHRHCENLGFRPTKDADIHVPEDPDVNLSDFTVNADEMLPQSPGLPTVKGHWLAVEGVQKGSTLCQGLADGKVGRPVSADLQLYYDNITKSILGVDEELMKLALVDVRTNGKIAPLLPKFVLFVSTGVKTLNHNIKLLIKQLHTVRALINNSTLYLELRPYLNLLVQGVLYCLVEPLAASVNPTNHDHWALRDYGARLLAQIIRDWSNPINQLKVHTVNVLKKVFCDLTKPFCCHYGAVMGLVAVGTDAVQDIILPQLSIYWPHLQTVMEDISYANAQLKADAHKVYGAMLLAAEFLIKSMNAKLLETIEKHLSKMSDCGTVLDNDYWICPPVNGLGPSDDSSAVEIGKHHKVTGDSFSIETDSQKALPIIYAKLYEYFGDALATKLPFDHSAVKYLQKKKKETIKKEGVILTDPVLKKSGEELLDMILSAPSPLPLKTVEEKEEDISSSAKSSVSEENDPSDDHSEGQSEQSNEPQHNIPGDYYDIDNEGDNKSFKSDKSENSFTEDDIQVKTVKEDPKQGIKLKITFNKRLKGKSFTESDTGSQSGESVIAQETSSNIEQPERPAEGRRGRKRKQSAVYGTEDTAKKPVLEYVPMKTTETSLVLKIKGTSSAIEKTEVRKARPLVHSDSSDDESPIKSTELHKWP